MRNGIEMTYNTKYNKWVVKTFHGGVLISKYSYAENDGMDFIAGLTNSMIGVRAHEKDKRILRIIKGGKNA